MQYSLKAALVVSVLIFWAAVAAAKSVVKDGEIEVNLQFLEYELEDFCVSKNEAIWRFLNGSDHDLKKLLNVELKESDFYKHELEVLQKHLAKKFSNERLQRLADIFSHPGAPLLGSMEFKEYRDYSIKLQELVGTMIVPCNPDEIPQQSSNESSTAASVSKKCVLSRKDINKRLFNEKNTEELKRLWMEWYRSLEEKNKKTKYDFVQQLSILDLEAEQNGEEELSEYWLKQMDITRTDYEKAKSLWREIAPLYDKLKNFMIHFIVQNFGKNVVRDQKTVPAHILGSLVSHDWITAAEKIGAFSTSEAHRLLQQSIKDRSVENLYKAADNQTSELKINNLPHSFYEKSRFNISSQTCQHQIMDYCKRENVFRAMFCGDEPPKVRDYVQINENVMRLKYQIMCGKEEEENGFLFREGPRDSAIYEAMEGLSSLRALTPEALEAQKLLTNTDQQQKPILSLLLTALHVIPPLPYYLASDLWRINALKEIDATVGENSDTTTPSTVSSTLHNLRRREVENSNKTEPEDGQEGESNNEVAKTYDTRNLTKDWWSYREKYQKVSTPDGEMYEDYLEDEYIIWNKPYLSKFLGKVLQFQILEKTNNLTSDLSWTQAILLKGKSVPWESLIEDKWNITDISAAAMLNYFKPLEEFLDKGNNFKNQSLIFNFDDLNFMSQGFSLNAVNTETEGEKPAEGSDALFFSFAAIAAVGIVAVIVTIGRRRYKRRQRARERKRRLAEL